MLLLLVLFTLAAFFVGVAVGPTIQSMIKTYQDDVTNSGEGRGSLGSCFPGTKDKRDPLIDHGDFWDPAAAAPKKQRKSKGKRKGK